MLRGTRKYWVAALLCGLLAAFLFFQYLQQIKASYQPGNLVKVIIASQNIKKDSVLTDGQLKMVEIPARYVASNSIHEKEQAIGKIAIMDITAGEVILPQKLVPNNNKEKLSYSVPVSRRAVAIPIDAVSGVAGNVMPGDRVDIIGTLDIETAGSDKPVSYSIYTLQDIPVLAVGTGTETKKSSGKSTMVLSVTPEEVQKLVLMSERGNIRLVLRSPADKSRVALPPLRLEELLK